MGPKIFLEFATLYLTRRKPKYYKFWSRKSKNSKIQRESKNFDLDLLVYFLRVLN